MKKRKKNFDPITAVGVAASVKGLMQENPREKKVPRPRKGDKYIFRGISGTSRKAGTNPHEWFISDLSHYPTWVFFSSLPLSRDQWGTEQFKISFPQFKMDILEDQIVIPDRSFPSRFDIAMKGLLDSSRPGGKMKNPCCNPRKNPYKGVPFKWEENRVAQTILEQMGGQRRLKAMIGARSFVSHGKRGTKGGSGLSFKWPGKGKGKPNYLKITLTPQDTYDMEFGKIWGLDYKVLKTFDGVYADMLIPIFEEQTGLYLRLNNPSGQAQEFISDEISHLIKDKGYPQKQAVAAAYSVARRKGFKVNNPSKKLSTAGRRKLPDSEYGLPKSRRYPMPDRGHAIAAKGRATEMLRKGYLTKDQWKKITRKADRILGEKVPARLRAVSNPLLQTIGLAANPPSFDPMGEIQNPYVSPRYDRPTRDQMNRLASSQGQMVLIDRRGEVYGIGEELRQIMNVRSAYGGGFVLTLDKPLTGKTSPLISVPDFDPLRIKFIEKNAKEKFEVGKSYFGRSIGDSEMIISFTVVKRTPRYIYVDFIEGDIRRDSRQGKPARLHVSHYEGQEFVRPWGRGSMSPGVYAGRELKDPPQKNPAWRAGKAHGVAPTKKAAKAAASRARSKTRLRKEYVEGGPLLHNPKTLTPPFRHGQRVKVEVAREWIVSTGDKDLLKQFDKALKLQTKANKRPKTVEWQELSIGSPDKLDAVTAFVKYGTSAESVYQAPKGSKKGQDYYVHKWGEGSGKEKPVDLLVSADGKTMISPIGDGQIIDDWMRG